MGEALWTTAVRSKIRLDNDDDDDTAGVQPLYVHTLSTEVKLLLVTCRTSCTLQVGSVEDITCSHAVKPAGGSVPAQNRLYPR